VSTHLPFPLKKAYADQVVRSIPQRPEHSEPATHPKGRSGHDVIGMLGLLLVTAILGLAAYFVTLYLL
jgi:hypothetical protein